MKFYSVSEITELLEHSIDPYTLIYCLTLRPERTIDVLADSQEFIDALEYEFNDEDLLKNVTVYHSNKIVLVDR